MNVLNIHERVLDAAPEQVGALLDSLASPADRLWAWHTWPRMAFDRPLAVGADGGHGPIRYIVVAYTPGRSIRFRFTGPAGFDGWHGFEVIQDGAQTLLRHTVKMRTHGRALLTWPLVYRPMHDALLEDTLTVAQASPGLTPVIAPWSARVSCCAGWSRAARHASSQSAVSPDPRHGSPSPGSERHMHKKATISWRS